MNIKSKVQKSTYMKKSTPYYFIAPAITIMLLMVLYPLLYGFYLSITDMSLKTFKHPGVIGFKNYFSVFKDPRLVATLIRTIFWTFINVFFHVSIGLLLAVTLNRKLPGKKWLRILLIIPWAMPQYISALTWKGMFNFKFGAINILLGKLGIDAVNWLSDPSLTFLAAIITNIWLGFPFMMMVALGGLQSIPKDLYEAAEIDGASSWQQFKNITLPLLKPTMTPSIVLGTVWTFNMLNVILIIAGGFGNEKTQILVTEVYRLSFQFYRYGYAAAYSVIIFIILLIFGIFYVKKSNVLGGDE
jgi:arabinogalactan oligomer/maltooligosaccharide transport system permease protein